VRQGSVLGAVISANSLETVVRDAQNGMAGSTLGNMCLYPLCFVDDIAAVSNSLMDARRNQAAIEVFQDRKRLQLHPEKSQYLVNRGNRKRRDEELKLNGMNMKKANEYKYLGEHINEKGTEMTTVQKRISEAAGVCNEILAVVSSNKLQNRRIPIGIRLATACLDSKLLYNAETWTKLQLVTLKSWKQFKITSINDSLVCREDVPMLPSFKNWESFR